MINKINSLETKQQNFGTLKISQNTFDYIAKDIFKNDKAGFDSFTKMAKFVEEQQANNPDCDIELFKGINLVGDSCPTLSVLTKDGASIQGLKIHTHQEIYEDLGEKESLSAILQAGNEIANRFKKEYLDKIETFWK